MAHRLGRLWLLIGLAACFGPVTAAGPAPSFEIDDLLRVKSIPGQPQIAPGGGAIAYVLADGQDERSIRAHKPMGHLLVHSRSDASTVVLAEFAADPVWSPAGDAIAFFDGLGEDRHLVVAPFPPSAGPAVRYPAPGELSRYSARHFAPAWSRAGRYLVIAEARIDEPRPAVNQPYTLSSQDQQVPDDAHFRDDTLWRLVRFDTVTGERMEFTGDIALRQLLPSPSGDVLALTTAYTDRGGYFAGDTYMQPVAHSVLSITTGQQRALELEAIELLGWQDDAVLIARASGELVAVDLATAAAAGGATDPESSNPNSGPNSNPSSGPPATVPLANSSGLQTAASWVASGPRFAAWGPADDKGRSDFVIPPPTPDELWVGQAHGGDPVCVLEIADDQEILQALWLPSGQLLVHTRDLATLAERLLLWTGTERRPLLELNMAIGPIAAASATGAAGLLAFAAESATAPAELFAFDIAGQDLTRLSRHNEALAARNPVAPILFEGATGTGTGTRWRALLYLPEHAGAEGGRSLVVRAYGRQTDQIHRFNAEAQMHVARGYAYLLPDVFPRRGALHQAYAEVLPAAVAVVRGRFDLDGKTGFLGGSLGGYAGLVLLTRSQVADAAVLRAPPAEFALSWATGKDRDADLLEYLMQGQRPDQDPSAYRADSPFWMADRIGAPTLFLHGSDDAQVPLAHSQWMFQALRRLGRAPTELRVYPGADHSVVRGNRRYTIDFYQQIFNWWERHLGPGSHPVADPSTDPRH